jgi:hypothetical protein
MLLASVRTHRHLDPAIQQSTKTRIGKGFNALVDEVQIYFHPLLKGGVGEPDDGLNASVRWGCG